MKGRRDLGVVCIGIVAIVGKRRPHNPTAAVLVFPAGILVVAAATCAGNVASTELGVVIPGVEIKVQGRASDRRNRPRGAVDDPSSGRWSWPERSRNRVLPTTALKES